MALKICYRSFCKYLAAKDIVRDVTESFKLRLILEPKTEGFSSLPISLSIRDIA